VSGLVAASQGGAGRSGIIYWDNLGGADSPIVGAYPTPSISAAAYWADQ
jgi:hypothetical protein